MEAPTLKRPADMRLSIEGALGKRRNSGRTASHSHGTSISSSAGEASQAPEKSARFAPFVPIPTDYDFQCRVNGANPNIPHHVQIPPKPLLSLPFLKYAPHVNADPSVYLQSPHQLHFVQQAADSTTSNNSQRGRTAVVARPDHIEIDKQRAEGGVDPASLAYQHHEQDDEGICASDSPEISDHEPDGESKSASPTKRKRVRLPTEKRKAQNRSNQRAFRERRDKHLRELEDKRRHNDQLFSALQAEIGGLRQLVGQLETELLRMQKERRAQASRPSTGTSNSTPSSVVHLSDSSKAGSHFFGELPPAFPVYLQ